MKLSKALILLLAMTGLNLGAQTSYKVIKVNGRIQYVRTGDNMTMGDVFSDGESLNFDGPNSRAAVINPEKGRLILSPESENRLTGVTTHFLPAMSNISTRGGSLNSLNDIQDYFSGSVAIINEAGWYINPYQFPMDEDRFFYLQYEYKGEYVTTKLKSDEDRLVFSREDILKVDDKPIPGLNNPQVTLYFYSPDNGSQYVSSFKLVFPDIKQLRTEAAIILEGYIGQEYNRKLNELSGYIFEFYGKPDKEDVMHFLEQDMGISR